MGTTSAPKEEAMAMVETSILIDRQVEDVYAYVTDVDKMTQWRGGVVEVEKVTDGPVGVGTRIRAVGKRPGGRSSMDVEVTEVEPSARFAYRGEAGPLSTINTYTFESDAYGTKVTHTDEVELRGMLRLIEPLLGRMLRRQFEADLASLKAHLEVRVEGN
jgi:uncharacterized protein YndB with AHSA1/START domain